MIHYTIDHYVTETDDGTDELNTTVHGDDAVKVWLTTDPTTDKPQLSIEQPPEGFTWITDPEGYIKHPPELDPEQYLDRIQSLLTDTELEQAKADSKERRITRVSPWETPLTDGETQQG
jgi:hypothetical protein